MSRTSIRVVPEGPLYAQCRVSAIQLALDEYMPEPSGGGHDAVFWAIGEAMDGHQRRRMSAVRKRIENGPSDVAFALAFAVMLVHPYCPWGVLYQWPRGVVPCWPDGQSLVYWRGRLYDRDPRGVLTRWDGER